MRLILMSYTCVETESLLLIYWFSVELLECVDLHSVIRLVLKTGNYMNAVSSDIYLEVTSKLG